MKILVIRWQRLVNEAEQTCKRCMDTGKTVENAYNRLKSAFGQLDINVELKKEIVDPSLFAKDPLQSNRIWIAEKSLEEWLGATVGASQCCDVCGDCQCRTLTVYQKIFEIIPEELIIRAALLAAAELYKQ